MELAKQRIDWIDVAKGLAMILIIAGHCVPIDVIPWTWIYSVHIPLFFMLAGYTFREKSTKSMFLSSAKRLLLPYFSVYLLCFATENVIAGTVPDVLLFLKSLAYGNSCNVETLFFGYTDGVGPIWFLLCLFTARMIFNTMLKITKKTSTPILFGIIISALCFGLGLYVTKSFGYIPFALSTAFISLIYLMIGYWFKEANLIDKIAEKKSTMFLLFVAWFPVSCFYGMNFSIVQFPLGIVSVAVSIAGMTFLTCLIRNFSRLPKNKPMKATMNVLTFIGRNSISVLSIHSIEGILINWDVLVYFIFDKSVPILSALSVVRVVLTIVIAKGYVFIKQKILDEQVTKR